MKTVHKFCTLSLVVAVAEMGFSSAQQIFPDHQTEEACTLSTWKGEKEVQSKISCITEVDLEEESSGWIYWKNWMSIWGTREGDEVTCKNKVGTVRFATYAAVGVAIEDAHKLCRYIYKQLQIRDRFTNDLKECFKLVSSPPFEFHGITQANWDEELLRVEIETTEKCRGTIARYLGLAESDVDDSRKCQKEISVDSSKSSELVVVPDGCYKPNTNDHGRSFQVTMYFVRHGESDWNEQSKTKWERALNKEVAMLTDAKLTSKGTMQARMLSEFIAKKGGEVEAMNSKADRGLDLRMQFDNTDDWKILNGQAADYAKLQPRKVVYATSNLRRASLTFLRAFQHLIKPDLKIDKLHILSALQEPAPNIDSNSLSKAGEPPALTLETCPIVHSIEEGKPFEMDAKCNRGDELKERNGETGDRLLDDFCQWMRNMAAFGHVPGADEVTTDRKSDPRVTDFVIAGHSMFLRGFFQRYLSEGDGDKKNELESALSSTIRTVGNGSLIKIRLVLNNPQTIEGDKTRTGSRICQIQQGETELLYGEVHGRNIARVVVPTIHAKPNNDKY